MPAEKSQIQEPSLPNSSNFTPSQSYDVSSSNVNSNIFIIMKQQGLAGWARIGWKIAPHDPSVTEA